ncbi:tRNA (adenosine(37)-N6)-dimethylallyltransferase MiaA [Arcanobacterium bovis]|uniref:tRNA dimethylallyltransferase n=1 Tax=Arcanobacterium bovis TaxID=2529275 RepID=A0A4Q9V112_9ACTO|nr:tRNA (adenosine(37)-N6)-dimethylallyltransferase MiaA [Arcanobacterium bovis]TBW22745.1 tRNA (adenosine(37)-N6)-dimethylallyltransferase MiaA [Arcanobacterium bovis]
MSLEVETPTTPIIAVVGATSSGKTLLSIEIAQALGGSEFAEIISADAMQLYRGMDVGTAKISVPERCGIVHHQLDVLDICEEASVAAYQKYARMDLENVRRRGKVPIVVGGSGLYVSGLLDELNFPGTDPKIRAELEERAKNQGMDALISELAKLDPKSAQIIDLANPRRVIRALEVVLLTGKSYTPEFPRHTRHFSNTHFVGIDVPKEILNERIERRVHEMFANGLVDETKQLMEQGLATSPTAGKATGYAQTIDFLLGKISQEQAIADIAFGTRRLAKKQRTWFGADPRIEWHKVAGESVNEAKSQLRELGKKIAEQIV